MGAQSQVYSVVIAALYPDPVSKLLSTRLLRMGVALDVVEQTLPHMIQVLPQVRAAARWAAVKTW